MIVGPEVTLHGISVIRVKLPEDSQTAFPWHQDSHYYNEHKTGRFEANTEHMRVITTWVPLVDVDTGNGCLWVIPGSHRWGFLSGARAATTGHVLIPEDVERRGTPTPLPMRAGDVVFLTNLTLHASKVNGSDRVRWSHDFRYHPTAASTPAGSAEREATDYLDTKSHNYGTEPLRGAQRRPHARPGKSGSGAAAHAATQSHSRPEGGLREETMADRIGSGEFTYEVEPAWAQLPDGWIIKDTPDVLVDDAHDRVYVFTRWKHPVMVFDRAGTFITSWGSDLFTMPHGLSAWARTATCTCVDAFGHCVRKCTTARRSAAGVGHAGPQLRTLQRQAVQRPHQGRLRPRHRRHVRGRRLRQRPRAQVLSRRRPPVLVGRAGSGTGPVQPRAQRADRPRRQRLRRQPRRPPRAGVRQRRRLPERVAQRRAPPQRLLHLPTAGRDRELVYVGEAGAGFGENRGIRGFGDCLAIFELDGTCLARIYHDAPVMHGPHGIGVDANGNIYLTQVLWGNGPWIDPMDQQMMLRLRRV